MKLQERTAYILWAFTDRCQKVFIALKVTYLSHMITMTVTPILLVNNYSLCFHVQG